MALYVGDEDVAIELEFRDYSDIDGVATDQGALDISSASEIQFKFLKPDGSTTTKSKSAGEVTLTTDGTDGKARYKTESSFLDQRGSWRVQGIVTIAGRIHYSEIETIKVLTPL